MNDGGEDFEPLGYGNRWYDRLEKRRHLGLLFIGAFAATGLLAVCLSCWFD
jgi:hypothetical protein